MADNIYNLKEDLSMSMTIAAFSGISWFIGAEINTSLFILFKRRTGLYFWSCALCSWGVVLQPLFIILADFGIWTNLTGAIICIYLTWLIMVVPQSWLLYSRLHLIVHNDVMLKWLRIILAVTSILFTVPTIVLGTIAQATNINPGLYGINLAWDRVQLTVFFVQETALSLLYIWQARKYLRNSSLLSQPYLSENTNANEPGATTTATTTTPQASPETKQVLNHLMLSNILVIALDIALLGVQYAGMFYLQGAFKPCVYGVKLKVEFAILNRLLEMVRRRGQGGGAGSSYSSYGDATGNSYPRQSVGIFKSQTSSQIKGEGGLGLGGGGGLTGPHVTITSSRASTRRRGGGGSAWGEDDEVSPVATPSGNEVGLQLERIDHRPPTGPTTQSLDARSFSRNSRDPIWDGPAGPLPGQAV